MFAILNITLVRVSCYYPGIRLDRPKQTMEKFGLDGRSPDLDSKLVLSEFETRETLRHHV